MQSRIELSHKLLNITDTQDARVRLGLDVINKAAYFVRGGGAPHTQPTARRGQANSWEPGAGAHGRPRFAPRRRFARTTSP